MTRGVPPSPYMGRPSHPNSPTQVGHMVLPPPFLDWRRAVDPCPTLTWKSGAARQASTALGNHQEERLARRPVVDDAQEKPPFALERDTSAGGRPYPMEWPRIPRSGPRDLAFLPRTPKGPMGRRYPTPELSGTAGFRGKARATLHNPKQDI